MKTIERINIRLLKVKKVMVYGMMLIRPTYRAGQMRSFSLHGLCYGKKSRLAIMVGHDNHSGAHVIDRD